MAYLLELKKKKKEVKVAIKWLSAIGHLSREEQWIRSSTEEQLYFGTHGDFNYPVFAKETAQHDISNSKGSQSA